jgi:DNA-binding transcriptional regulator YhcF (GntR family)
MRIIHINERSKVPKYKQIVSSVEAAIITGKLKKGDRLPSLNAIRLRHDLSRDTVLVAFNELKNRGIINSVVGKGYYVSSEDIAVTHKIFVLFDELNSFKEDLYNAFLSELSENVQVDVFFHHFNKQMFDKTIQDNVGEYNYYVLMPANLANTSPVIRLLPDDKVYILDQVNDELMHYPAVFQNFKKDMYQGLMELKKHIKKYAHLFVLFSPEKQPLGLKEGVQQFCEQEQIKFCILNDWKETSLQKNSVYIVLDDRSLLNVVKKAKEQNFQLAKDIGVICYNDSLLKEIVEGGITTISTDFQLMGKQLAQMIQSKQTQRIENNSKTIIRNSI